MSCLARTIGVRCYGSMTVSNTVGGWVRLPLLLPTWRYYVRVSNHIEPG